MEKPVPLSKVEIGKRLQSAYKPEKNFSTDEFSESSIQESGKSLKCAAVLIPLICKDSEWHLVFTRRTDSVENHKGQVSFPGGSCDENETQAEKTALREALEEIGLNPLDVQIVGRMNDVATITQFRVTPVVGFIPWPYEFRLSRYEVSRVFSIPLNWLAQPTNWDEFSYSPEGIQRVFPVITYQPYESEILWGVTARITQNLLGVLGLIR